MDLEPEQPTRLRGIYLLPNLFTTAALFAGFYAIIAAMKGNFDSAAIAVFVAMIMDALDGRVARLTNTQSEFGVQYDSLSDMVSFGLAPALVMYQWALVDLGKLGWLAAFIYAAAAALRLARFNTQVAVVDKKYFQGLASPAAAGMVIGLVWVFVDFDVQGSRVNVLAAIMTVLAGILMVSNFRYYSFKGIDFKGKVPFFSILLIVVFFVAISVNPPQILFYGFLLYGISGPLLTLWGVHKRRKERLVNSKTAPDDDF